MLILTSCSDSTVDNDKKLPTDQEIIDFFVVEKQKVDDKSLFGHQYHILPGCKDFNYDENPEYHIKVEEIRSDIENDILQALIYFYYNDKIITKDSAVHNLEKYSTIITLKKYDQGWVFKKFDNNWD